MIHGSGGAIGFFVSVLGEANAINHSTRCMAKSHFPLASKLICHVIVPNFERSRYLMSIRKLPYNTDVHMSLKAPVDQAACPATSLAYSI